MLIKFLNGDIIEIPEYQEEHIILFYNRIQNHIYDNLSESLKNDLNILIPEQIDYVSKDDEYWVEQESNEYMFYIIIRTLDYFKPINFFSFVESNFKDYDIITEKLTKYVQYLCDNNRLIYSSSSKYDDIYYKSYDSYEYSDKEEEEEEYVTIKISSVSYSRGNRLLKKVKVNKIDEEYYLIENIPFSVTKTIYYITATFHKNDLD